MQSAGITRVDVNAAATFHYRRLGDRYVITNDYADWVVLDADEFRRFVEGDVETDSPLYAELKAKRLLHSELLLADAANRYGGRKWFLNHGPHRHYIAITERSGTSDGADMSSENLDRAVDCAFMSTSPTLEFVFGGGDPLCNWDGLERCINYIESKNRLAAKRVSIIIRTPLSSLTESQATFFATHTVALEVPVTSRGKKVWGHIQQVTAAYQAAELDLETCHVTAVFAAKDVANGAASKLVAKAVTHGCQTIAASLPFYDNFAGAFDSDTCSVNDWCKGYEGVLDACLASEQDGNPIAERLAQLFSEKLLGDREPASVEVRSPAADGIGQLAYHWDGRVYTSDLGRRLSAQAEDDMFYLGELRYHGYHDMITSPTVRALVVASTLEGQPGCHGSAYAAFGGLSPAYCYIEQGSIHGRAADNSWWRCQTAILDALIVRLDGPQKDVVSALTRWGEPS